MITYSPAHPPLFDVDIPVSEGWRVLAFDQILPEISQLSPQGVIVLEARVSGGDLDLLKTVLCRERFIYLYSPGQESKAAEALRLGVRHVLCVTDSRRALPLLMAILPEQNTSACPSPPLSESCRHDPGPERKIEDIRKILRQFQEVANVGYWIYDQKGNHLLWSEQVYRIFGLEPREGYETYEGFMQYVHPEDRQRLTEAYLRHLDTGEPYIIIHRVVLDSGSVKTVRESCESTWNPETQSWHSLGVVADITDLRQSEENMAALLNKVESLLEGQPDRILIFRRDLRITDCYPKDPSRYLVPPEKFPDRPIEEVDIPVSLKEMAASTVKNVLENHTPERREYSLTAGEETAYFDARFLPSESDQVMTVNRDITETKQLQAEQKSQNELLEILIQTAMTFINLPVDHTEQAINHSLHQLGEFVGADRFYVFSYDLTAMTTSNTHEWCSEGIEPMIDALQDVPLEGFDVWLNHHLEGETYYIPDVTGMDPGDPVYNILEPQGIKTLLSMPLFQEGKLVGFIGLDYVRHFHQITPWEEKLLKVFAEMLSNIKNRSQLLKQITDNRNFLNDIIQNSPSVIYTKDDRGCYTLLNRKWSQLTGLDEKSCLGKTDGELVRHSRKPIDPLTQVYESTRLRVSQFEEWMELEDERHYFLTTEFPLRSSNGQEGLAGIRTEITGLKKLENERLARRSAEIELEQKNLFLAKMSHEVRTPLSAIIGFSRRLINFPGIPLEVLNKIMIIYRSGETMLAMINNMLNYAKTRDEKLSTHIVEFSLQNLLGDLEEVLRYRTNEKAL
ncbi:MAG: PAS domain S-box protein, partial [bacterium]